jgi:predicted  nucleic acid-binding Zn-ribbon protein
MCYKGVAASWRQARKAAMSVEPENFTLALLRKIDNKVDGLREEMVAMRDTMATKSELRSEINSLRADVASDLANIEKQLKDQEKRLGDQIGGLRRSVMEYHSSAIGHGVLLTELEERVSRLEQQASLSSERH